MPNELHPLAFVPALSRHLAAADPLLESLELLPHFRGHCMAGQLTRTQTLSAVLHGCWHHEHVLNELPELTLSQAVEAARSSIKASLRAFLLTLGAVYSSGNKLLQREAGRLTVRNAYPRTLASYAAGPYTKVSVHRLPLRGNASPLAQTQTLLGDCLARCRRKHAIKVRQEVRADPLRAIRHTVTGRPLLCFRAEHWDLITWRLGYTTVFDLLNEMPDDNDVTLPKGETLATMLRALCHVVSFINSVHEAYVLKAVGAEHYQGLLFQCTATAIYASSERFMLLKSLVEPQPSCHA